MGGVEWIEAKAARQLDPRRVSVALTSLDERWPAGQPPLEQVVEGFAGGEANLLHLLSISPIAAERMISDPAALPWLAEPEVCQRPRGLRAMGLDLRREQSDPSLFDSTFRALRVVKGREMLRIALREVAGLSTLEQTTLELSSLAELCVREVYQGWLAELSRRWGRPETECTVLGMGKFGGEELNYSSDIDVIFFYDDEGFINPKFSNHQFFTRFAEKVVATFATTDKAGSLFRIDLRLRPEGSAGPLVRSLESTENYYSGFGETWERMALIKARRVAGSEELAYEWSQRLQPFIFPRTLSHDLLDEIGALKDRIEREIVGAENLTRNVKLGYGGIREIEFVVQTFQLLHGARNAFLQERNTLKTLRALQQLQIIPRDDMQTLADAYRFLRTVEHRLQIEREQQTHTLPEKPAELDRLGRSLGFSGGADFASALSGHTHAVRSIFDKVLRRTGEGSRHASTPIFPTFFHDSARAQKTLGQLGQGTGPGHVSPRTRKLFAKLEPLLLQELESVADPDVALDRFVRFVEGYGIRGLLFELLVVNPNLLQLLIKLFDASRFLTDIVLRRPQLLEEIARDVSLDRSFQIEDYRDGLSRNEENLPPLDWVRVYRRSQILRIALRDILQLSEIDEVQSEFSALAEACLAHVQTILGLPDEITIVALGKFGGEELIYGCDLDVVFVGNDSSAAEEIIKAMSSMTSEGLIFPVDARLRPEGKAGLLAVPITAYEGYFASRAQLWEAQALTKARAISGPQQKEFEEFARQTWLHFGQRPELLAEIRSMHRRVVRERAGTDEFLDFKTGRGGLMAIEFAVQARQMAAQLWQNNTLRAVEGLRSAGILDDQVAGRLKSNYCFLRRCEAVVRRVDNAGISVLPREEIELTKVARRLGFNGLEEFRERYRHVRQESEELFEVLMGAKGSRG